MLSSDQILHLSLQVFTYLGTYLPLLNPRCLLCCFNWAHLGLLFYFLPPSCFCASNCSLRFCSPSSELFLGGHGCGLVGKTKGKPVPPRGGVGLVVMKMGRIRIKRGTWREWGAFGGIMTTFNEMKKPKIINSMKQAKQGSKQAILPTEVFELVGLRPTLLYLTYSMYYQGITSSINST